MTFDGELQRHIEILVIKLLDIFSQIGLYFLNVRYKSRA